MPYSSELIANIRRLHFYEHYSIHAVSKVVGLHRDTVKRILYNDDDPSEKLNRGSILDPYKEVIDDHLNRYPGIRGTKLLRIIKDRGYKGSLNTVLRYIRPLRKKHKKTYKPMSFVAGEGAQVDWAHFGKIKVAGGERKLYLFVMVLSYSRAIYAEYTFDMGTDSFLRLHDRAISYFGGTARKILYDNLKSAVIDRVGKEVRFNPQLIELSGFYGFEAAACNPYAGNEKGRVERSIRYIRDSFASGHNQEYLDGLNSDLREWLDTVANLRPWPEGRDKTVKDKWLEEREFLQKPLHNHSFQAKFTKVVRSSKHGLVRFDLNDYSIPEKYQGESLTLTADDNKVDIFSDNQLVAEHQRCYGRGQRIMNADHWHRKLDKNNRQKTDYILRLVPELEACLRQLIRRGENKTSMLKRFTQLYRLHSDEAFRVAVNTAIESKSYHPEQISRLLSEQSNQHHKLVKPIHFAKDRDYAKLHIVSHPLDDYDLF